MITGFNEGQEIDASGTDVGSMLENPDETLEDGVEVSKDSNDESDEVEDTGPNPEVALQKFEELGVKYNELIAHESGSKAYLGTLSEISTLFLSLRYTSAQLNRLINAIRSLVSEIRFHDRRIMRLCVEKGKMPKKYFIDRFQGRETDASWLEKSIQKYPDVANGIGRSEYVSTEACLN